MKGTGFHNLGYSDYCQIFNPVKKFEIQNKFNAKLPNQEKIFLLKLLFRKTLTVDECNITVNIPRDEGYGSVFFLHQPISVPTKNIFQHLDLEIKTYCFFSKSFLCRILLRQKIRFSTKR